MQPVEPRTFPAEQVVLDDAPVFGPVGADDCVVVVCISWGRRSGLPREVGGALALITDWGTRRLTVAVDRRRPRVILWSLC